MQLSVIIVNYNVKYFLEHCLLSVIKACRNISAEILVADNHSTDGSKTYLEPKFPSVRFFWNTDNPGFAAANNQMLAKATGQYILFLNPDTIVAEDCFEKCIGFFSAVPDCGALGVRMTDGSGTFLRESKRSLPGLLSGFCKSIGYGDLYYAAHLPEKENNKTAVLAGAFMMLSREAIERTKGFDENFFMYGEDVDLSYRVTQAGLFNYYFAGTTIIHFKGESTAKQSSFYLQHFYGAMSLFAKKHYRRKGFYYPVMMAGIAVSKMIAQWKNKRSLTKTAHEQLPPTVTVIGGNEEDIEHAENILRQAKEIKNIRKKIINVQEPVRLSAEESNGTVIFCEGALSNKSIIEALEHIPKTCTALFCKEGAASIIGSNRKDTNGIIIAMS
ncbi:MAG: glycosyltransferase family 2 protein [Ferruginibacter sp.]